MPWKNGILIFNCKATDPLRFPTTSPYHYSTMYLRLLKEATFSLQSWGRVPYRNHLKWANLSQRILVLPGRGELSRPGEYMPWRWDQENRRAYPRVFSALRAHRNVWHIWTRTGQLSSDWPHDNPRPLLTQQYSNITNLKFRFIRVRQHDMRGVFWKNNTSSV